jgi:hypothetical protein
MASNENIIPYFENSPSPAQCVYIKQHMTKKYEINQSSKYTVFYIQFLKLVSLSHEWEICSGKRKRVHFKKTVMLLGLLMCTLCRVLIVISFNQEDNTVNHRNSSLLNAKIDEIDHFDGLKVELRDYIFSIQ